MPTNADLSNEQPSNLDEVLASRHPSVSSVARFLVEVNTNLPAPLYGIAATFRQQTWTLLDRIPDGPELTVALRKLLEAKDAAVRAALDLVDRS